MIQQSHFWDFSLSQRDYSCSKPGQHDHCNSGQLIQCTNWGNKGKNQVPKKCDNVYIEAENPFANVCNRPDARWCRWCWCNKTCRTRPRPSGVMKPFFNVEHFLFLTPHLLLSRSPSNKEIKYFCLSTLRGWLDNTCNLFRQDPNMNSWDICPGSSSRKANNDLTENFIFSWSWIGIILTVMTII